MTRILIHSPCGGCGVTTVAANLGLAISRNGYPTLIKGHSVARYFVNWQTDTADQEVPAFLGTRKVQVDSQLYIASDYSYAASRNIATSPIRDGAKNSNEFTVVDSGNEHLPCSEELSQYQFLIVIVNPDANSFHELAGVMKALCQIKEQPLQIKPLVLLNNYNPESLLSRDIYSLLESSLLQSFYPDVLLRDESVNETLACGVPLTEHAPYSPVSQVLSVLAEHLIQWSDENYAAA